MQKRLSECPLLARRESFLLAIGTPWRHYHANGGHTSTVRTPGRPALSWIG